MKVCFLCRNDNLTFKISGGVIAVTYNGKVCVFLTHPVYLLCISLFFTSFRPISQLKFLLVAVGFAIFVCPFSACNNFRTAEWIFIKFEIGVFS